MRASLGWQCLQTAGQQHSVSFCRQKSKNLLTPIFFIAFNVSCQICQICKGDALHCLVPVQIYFTNAFTLFKQTIFNVSKYQFNKILEIVKKRNTLEIRFLKTVLVKKKCREQRQLPGGDSCYSASLTVLPSYSTSLQYYNTFAVRYGIYRNPMLSWGIKCYENVLL